MIDDNINNDSDMIISFDNLDKLLNILVDVNVKSKSHAKSIWVEAVVIQVDKRVLTIRKLGSSSIDDNVIISNDDIRGKVQSYHTYTYNGMDKMYKPGHRVRYKNKEVTIAKVLSETEYMITSPKHRHGVQLKVSKKELSPYSFIDDEKQYSSRSFQWETRSQREKRNITLIKNINYNNNNVNDDNEDNIARDVLYDGLSEGFLMGSKQQRIFKILQIGLIFEYLNTSSIKNLLSLSRTLLNFKVPPKILDHIVMESFHDNQKKMSNLCKVILPSSISESKSESNSSSISVAPALSDVDAHELLIKLHAKPLKLFDLKTGYQIMKKIKCCFNINSVRIIKENLDDSKKGVSIIEISKKSQLKDFRIAINHLAVKVENKEKFYTMIPKICGGCRRNICICRLISCSGCNNEYCGGCVQISFCGCGKRICEQCTGDDEDFFCRRCDEVLCCDCYGKYCVYCCY